MYIFERAGDCIMRVIQGICCNMLKRRLLLHSIGHEWTQIPNGSNFHQKNTGHFLESEACKRAETNGIVKSFVIHVRRFIVMNLHPLSL